MEKRILWRYAVALAAAAVLSGCSLLKVSVSTGEPLPKEAVEVRTLTRGFYYEMADQIARTADSIVAAASDPEVRLAAVRWKIRATRAGVNAAMQGGPEVAMADLWILCRRMDAAFAAAPDSLLFGPQSGLARETARGLASRAGRLARRALDPQRYGLMARFVGEYVRDHPAGDGTETAPTTLAWVEFLRENGLDYDYATGTIAEVLADVNDRLSGQTQQLSRSVGWSKDLLEMQLRQDSLRTQLGARLDSMERGFDRLVRVAEHLPQISERVMSDLNEQAEELIGSMNGAVDNLFADFGRQRLELQAYVTREREELVTQLRTSADELVRQTLDAVPALVGKVLLYLVLALAVLLGGPFALGFWLGGVRQRARERKKPAPASGGPERGEDQKS